MTNTPIADETQLEAVLSEPSQAARDTLAALPGDIVVLGAGGKMGPTLCMMLKKASPDRKIYAVSRFTDAAVQSRIEQADVETVQADLLDDTAYGFLPDAAIVFYLIGMKFGTTGKQPLTWALNVYVPALAARHYKDARIVALSTGNVYPFVDAAGKGASEQTPPDPVGEYAQSCLGRERMFEHFSQQYGTAVTLIRLNYANEPRYGIIVDLTQKLLADEPIDLTMGAANLIWQADANDYIIRSASLTASPPAILNVTGPEVVSIRHLAKQIANLLGKKPRFASKEAPTALLSDASYCHTLFDRPRTTLDQMTSLITDWLTASKPTLNKPTHYTTRNGKF